MVEPRYHLNLAFIFDGACKPTAKTNLQVESVTVNHRTFTQFDTSINIVCLPWTDGFYFPFYVLIGVSLKGVDESSLLSKDAPLTLNIDTVMGV